jgi:hypothetical protein
MVLDCSMAGIGDTVKIHKPSVGLSNMSLKISAKEWIWNGDEEYMLDLPVSADSPADLLLELQGLLIALTRTTQNVDMREDES